jgi:hypothetical protein
VGYRDDGSFTALLTFDQAGEHRVQAIAHGDGVRATGASRLVSLTVGCPQPPSPVPPGSGCEAPSAP